MNHFESCHYLLKFPGSILEIFGIVVIRLKKNTCLLIFMIMSGLISNAQDSGSGNEWDSIPFYNPSHFLSQAGPRNYDTSNYAIVILYRLPSAVGDNLWFSIVADSEQVARISIKSRFLVKIPREGIIKIESQYNTKSTVELNIKFGHTYYVRVEGELTANKVYAKLSVMINTIGTEENKKEQWTDYYMDYPWVSDIYHIHMMQVTDDQPEYILNLTDPIAFYDGKFLPPASARFYYYLRNSGIYNLPHCHFEYKNWFLSSTFYKEINIYREDKVVDSLEELEKYVKKSIKDGNRLVNSKKESLTVLKYETIPELGDLAAGFYAEIKKEKEYKNKSPFTELTRTYVIYIFKKLPKHKNAYPVIGKMHAVAVMISESGLPDEVHSYEEMRNEILKFCAGISF